MYACVGDLDEALIEAAQKSCTKAVRVLSSSGANGSVVFDVRDGDCSMREATLLHLAAIRGDISLASTLLMEHNVEVDLRAGWGKTPMRLAIREGHETMVQLLLERGAEIELRDFYDDQTPLLWAVESDQYQIVRLLLNRGANTEAQDADGRKALMLAAKEDQIGTLDVLLIRGEKL